VLRIQHTGHRSHREASAPDWADAATELTVEGTGQINTGHARERPSLMGRPWRRRRCDGSARQAIGQQCQWVPQINPRVQPKAEKASLTVPIPLRLRGFVSLPPQGGALMPQPVGRHSGPAKHGHQLQKPPNQQRHKTYKSIGARRGRKANNGFAKHSVAAKKSRINGHRAVIKTTSDLTCF